MNLPKHVEEWSDERGIGNGIIVTLHYGYSFCSVDHAGVRGFDTVAEARKAITLKNLYPCRCQECVRGMIKRMRRTK